MHRIAFALMSLIFVWQASVLASDTGTADAYIKQAKAFEDTGRFGDAERHYQLALR